MTPKLTREQAAERERLIAEGIARVGIQVLDYRGKPREVRAWERSEARKRAGNRERDRGKRGRADDSTFSRHVARLNAREAKDNG